MSVLLRTLLRFACIQLLFSLSRICLNLSPLELSNSTELTNCHSALLASLILNRRNLLEKKIMSCSHHLYILSSSPKTPIDIGKRCIICCLFTRFHEIKIDPPITDWIDLITDWINIIIDWIDIITDKIIKKWLKSICVTDRPTERPTDRPT